jgi:hypothetical protein
MLCEALLQVVGNANVVSIAVRASDYVEGWHLREGERVLLHRRAKTCGFDVLGGLSLVGQS